MGNFFRKSNLIKKHKKLATFLAVMVALVTTYLLILPAITLDMERAREEPGVEVEQSSQLPPSLPALGDSDSNLGSATESSQEADTSQTESTENDLITLATTLTATNQDYMITADVNADAQLPKDTSLTVKEIKTDDEAYQSNYEKVKNSLTEKTIDSVLFYDITFESKGEKVEPKADVKVTIIPKEAMDAKDNFDVLHFPDDGSQENISQKDVKEIDHKITSVSFDNSQFSDYALVTSSNLSESKANLNKVGGPRSTTTHNITFKYTDNAGVEHEMVTAQIVDGGTISVFPIKII